VRLLETRFDCFVVQADGEPHGRAGNDIGAAGAQALLEALTENRTLTALFTDGLFVVVLR
jgi:hypothetical protein